MPVQGTPDTGIRSPEDVLEALHTEADHKAALKMFYAAADLCRDYHGRYADETKAQRENLAVEYEMRGRIAEQEHKDQGTTLTEPPPHSAAGLSGRVGRWHCPACHADFPEQFVICGKCGLDFRTGQIYGTDVKPKIDVKPRSAFPKPWTGNTKVSSPRHLGSTKSRGESIAIWIAGGIVAALIILALLALGKQHLMPVSSSSSGVISQP